MSTDDNLYRAPRTSLDKTAQDDSGLTPAMVEYLSKGAFWARVQKRGLFHRRYRCFDFRRHGTVG